MYIVLPDTASPVGTILSNAITSFSAAAVATGVEQPSEEVETHCDSLVHREQFLRPQGTSEWPDGTVAARYGFVHALYQEVLDEQISASRQIRLHRQIGEREEQEYNERAREIAAELAVHFERGREYHKAVQYLQYAGENAVRRSAHIEGVAHFTAGLALLNHSFARNT
jgi:predicted ATPase